MTTGVGEDCNREVGLWDRLAVVVIKALRAQKRQTVLASEF